MKKKYVVVPGRVKSRRDGALRYVSAEELIRLYGVKRSECRIVYTEADLGGLDDKGLVFLFPDPWGEYSIPQRSDDQDGGFS